MSRLEIRGLFVMTGKYTKHFYPYGINLREKLWWWFMPGVVINVAWPRDAIVVAAPGHPLWSGLGPTYEEIHSTDPNDHYRSWLEENVGQQGWDWDWGLTGNDSVQNRLTIKIRQKYAEYATIAAMRWA